MNINWYPGHMTKARRMIEEYLPQVDMAVEILDARIPASSRNPDIIRLSEKFGKKTLIVLNKSDLSDPNANKKWLEYYKNECGAAMLYDAKKKSSAANADFFAAVKGAFSDKLERNAARGMIGKSLKIMILGIPNAGKSTVINNLCGEKKAKAEDRPGVTRTKQWISAGGLDILDTPGILWPKLEDKHAAVRLAVTGAIRDEILDTEELAAKFVEILKNDYPKELCARYKLTELSDDPYEILHMIAKKRGFIVSGGEVDLERTSLILLDEFRAGKIGRITLDSYERLHV